MTELRIWCEKKVADGGVVKTRISGNYKDLLKMISVAFDDEAIREIVKDALIIDMIHDERVGRKDTLIK